MKNNNISYLSLPYANAMQVNTEVFVWIHFVLLPCDSNKFGRPLPGELFFTKTKHS